MASTQCDCHCIEGLFLCPSCKDAAETRYSETFQRPVLFGGLVLPSEAEELRHLENFGTYSLHGKVFGICCQLEYLCVIAAHPENWRYIRMADEIAEYELCWSSLEKAASDRCLVEQAENHRLMLGRWPIDHVLFQTWLYGIINCQSHVLFNRVTFIIARYYKEDVLDLLDEGPTVQLQHSFLCFRMLLDVFEDSL